MPISWSKRPSREACEQASEDQGNARCGAKATPGSEVEARLTRIDDPMENQRLFSRYGLEFLPRGSASVGFGQIFADELGIRFADRRVEDLDHLSDLSVPEGLAPLWRCVLM